MPSKKARIFVVECGNNERYEYESWQYLSSDLHSMVERSGKPEYVKIECRTIPSEKTKAVKVEVYDTRTGKSVVYPNAGEAADALGIQRTLIYYYLREKCGRYGNYIIRRKRKSYDSTGRD